MIDDHPIGAMVIWLAPGKVPRHGWLLCDGAAVSRTRYSALFAVIGTTCGHGDGVTTFNVPNPPSDPPMAYIIRAEHDAFTQEVQRQILDVVASLRDPEDPSDACELAADALEKLAEAVGGGKRH